MSYCRFNFEGQDDDLERSDVYCYQDADGPYVVRRYDRPAAKYLPSAEACRDYLLDCRTCGYRIPQYAIDELEEEIAAKQNA